MGNTLKNTDLSENDFFDIGSNELSDDDFFMIMVVSTDQIRSNIEKIVLKYEKNQSKKN